VWFLSPRDELPPDTTEVEIQVAEVGCASGEGAAGRMLPPRVQVSDQAVTIWVETKPRGDATCPAHPLAPLSVSIGEPLDSRVLIDGYGRVDDGEAAVPRPCSSDSESSHRQPRS